MSWQRMALWVIALGLIFSDIGACAGPQTAQDMPAALSGPSGLVAQILADPAGFESKTVTIEGVFQGWRGACRSGPPVSRNDWMIADSSGCLYVHGPVPPGLNPARPSGEKISLTGTVRLKMGQPYLDTSR